LGFVGLAIVLVGLTAFPLLWRSAVKGYYERRIFTIAEVAPREVAIVFGAAVRSPERLSTVLRDRMDTAIELYERGAVSKLLLSGGEFDMSYSEPAAMRDYALRAGVSADDVWIDSGGIRTYASCYRAASEFGVQSALLVTQSFHLPRAMFTCDRLGIDAVGVSADRRSYMAADWYEIRETAATVVALYDVFRREAPRAISLLHGLRWNFLSPLSR
jgi:SanA protein